MRDRLVFLLKSAINVVSVVSVLAIAVLVGRQFMKDVLVANEQPSARSDGSSAPAVGSHARVPGVDFSAHQKTIIAVMSVGCGLTSVGSDLFRQAVALAQRDTAVDMVAVFQEAPDRGKAYLDSLGLPSPEIKQAVLSTVPAAITPTLMIVDSKGVVEHAWAGRLADSSAEIRAALGLPSPRTSAFQPARVLNSEDVPGLLNDSLVQVMDVRSREDFQASHLKGAINIPLDEMPARAVHEFRLDAPIVVMCGRCDECERGDSEQRLTALCTQAFTELKNAGFVDIRMLRRDPRDMAASAIAMR